VNISPNRCVLVVDDDPGIRLLLVTFLRRRGFQLLQASNGREAIAEMRTGKPDVVVMDLMMPEVSGWEVLRVRAAEPSLLAIPMIVVTADNSRKVTGDLLDKHVSSILGKPFDLDVLSAAVAACLEPPRSPNRRPRNRVSAAHIAQ
jgi:CheY-like chemotaxis protein